MMQWQGRGKRRVAGSLSENCSSNYTRTNQGILIPNQESPLCKRLQPNSSFFMPYCSYLFQSSLDKKGSDDLPTQGVCCTWAWSPSFQYLGGFGLQWFLNAFKLAKWLSCLVEVKPTGSKLYGSFLHFERIFSGDKFLYRKMGGFF